MRKTALFFGLLLSVTSLFAQGYEYKFRLTLKDKGTTSYTIDKPEEFLSQRALERRQRQGIAIDASDLPISKDYIKAIEDLGGIVVAKSKWQKTLSVHCADSMMVDKFKELPFVSDALFVWRAKVKVEKAWNDSIENYPAQEMVTFGNEYGKGLDNIKPNNGQYLHQAGFKGEGMEIAVIDGGFSNFPKIEMLDNVNIKGYKGFIYENEELFDTPHSHGLSVLSCIATNKPMQFVGTAPEASFWLLNTEDARSEFPIEEDYWATAIEYADSVGVDVVNTSLGYSNFDFPAKSYTHENLNGKAYISRSADLAADKGMLLVISAGNSGNSEWRKLTPPSDAVNVLAMGAIGRDSIVTNFSSRGMTADLRVKPDAMALGQGSVVVNNKGLVSRSSGTSFSSPIMCGMVACLWQAFPTLTNKEILRVVREAGSKYENFDEDYGYGIPDMKKAMELAQALVQQKEAAKKIKEEADKKEKKASKKKKK